MMSQRGAGLSLTACGGFCFGDVYMFCINVYVQLMYNLPSCRGQRKYIFKPNESCTKITTIMRQKKTT